jgi:hypothetical protein
MDDRGRLVAETNVRCISANLGIGKNDVSRHLANLRGYRCCGLTGACAAPGTATSSSPPWRSHGQGGFLSHFRCAAPSAPVTLPSINGLAARACSRSAAAPPARRNWAAGLRAEGPYRCQQDHRGGHAWSVRLCQGSDRCSGTIGGAPAGSQVALRCLAGGPRRKPCASRLTGRRLGTRAWIALGTWSRHHASEEEAVCRQKQSKGIRRT